MLSVLLTLMSLSPNLYFMLQIELDLSLSSVKSNLASRGSSELMGEFLSLIFLVFHQAKVVEGCLDSTLALVSSPESTWSFRNDSFHSGTKVLSEH